MKGHWRLPAAAFGAVAMTVAVAAAAGRTAVTPAQRVATPTTAAAGAAQAAQGYGRLAAAFVENRGQTDPRVRFYVQGKRSAVFVTPREVMLSVARPGSRLGIA